MAKVLLVLILLKVLSDGRCSELVYHHYCIVGAGPAGLQLGYFLGKADRDYLVLDRANASGSFFMKYPRHRKLISINKRNTGRKNKEFNLRHDWNSLLSDDESLQFKHYSRDFFPDADTYLKYLEDFRVRNNIKVQFNTEVSNVRKILNTDYSKNFFLMDDQRDNTYKCHVVVMANGVSIPNVPVFKGSEFVEEYADISVDPDDYEAKSVLILGHGNSAFEVADSIIGRTNFIHMLGRSRIRLSWETHYVGDLRAVNNALLDTYQLKSLDGIAEADMSEAEIKKIDDRLYLLAASSGGVHIDDNFAFRTYYDKVISCLGFKYDFSIFNNSLPVKSAGNGPNGITKKFPAIFHHYESKQVPGLFFAGVNTHSLDVSKSAGGFIHGYRYTVKALHRLLEYRYHGIEWPSISIKSSQIVKFILRRVNEASDMYQMFSILGDVILIKENGESAECLEGYPIKTLADFTKLTGKAGGPMIVVTLQYGANFSGPGSDPFRTNRATGQHELADKSNFLHPVLYYYDRAPSAHEMASLLEGQVLPKPLLLHHMVEDFLTEFTALDAHVDPLYRFIDAVLRQDTRWKFADDCFKHALTQSFLPMTCRQYYAEGVGIVG